MDRLLWLDLGGRRALGLGAVSLRPLVLGRGIRLVLVSGTALRASLLESGAGGLLRLRRIPCRVRFWRRWVWMGSASPVRGMPSLVGPWILRRISRSQCTG